jgi:cold shock CspA family protein
MPERQFGRVVNWNPARGCGFIATGIDGPDVMLPIRSLSAAGISSVNIGDRISFDVMTNNRGPFAVNVQMEETKQ